MGFGAFDAGTGGQGVIVARGVRVGFLASTRLIAAAASSIPHAVARMVSKKTEKSDWGERLKNQSEK